MNIETIFPNWICARPVMEQLIEHYGGNEVAHWVSVKFGERHGEVIVNTMPCDFILEAVPPEDRERAEELIRAAKDDFCNTYLAEGMATVLNQTHARMPIDEAALAYIKSEVMRIFREIEHNERRTLAAIQREILRKHFGLTADLPFEPPQAFLQWREDEAERKRRENRRSDMDRPEHCPKCGGAFDAEARLDINNSPNAKVKFCRRCMTFWLDKRCVGRLYFYDNSEKEKSG